MSLLNEILQEVGGNTLTTEHHSMLFDTVVGMITNPQAGGLQGLLESFKNKGLGDIFSSWISTGKNLPVSPDQIQQVLGQGQIQQIARKLGLDSSQVSEGLSKLMPQIVDKLSPKGEIPPEDLLGEGLNTLKKLFGI
jgi:uncharacterized protein YidB (DUF937 family)